jgi:hypothetical protein
VQALDGIVNAPYGTEYSMGRAERKAYVAALLIYFQVHMESFGEMRSWQILQEVMA